MTDQPQPWKQAAIRDRLLRSVAEGPSLLMLDYDGTLAPFAEDRLRAVPYPGVSSRLEDLATLPGVRLVLITGRPAWELRRLLTIGTPVEIWGSHGREQITAAGDYRIDPLTPGQQSALELVETKLREQTPAEALERKPASLAIHWRAMPEDLRGEFGQEIDRLYTEHSKPAGLHLLRFDGGVEIRSGDINKGHAVKRILQGDGAEPAPVTVAYLGDDTTDEDAFLALKGRGITMLVREEWRDSAAEYWIRPPAELLEFLDTWITAARQRKA